MNPNGSKQTLFNFNGSFNGYLPLSTLVKKGNRLYGTTFNGGSQKKDQGTIFSVGVDGKAFKISHRFNLYGGNVPSESTTLQFDATGDLFGTTINGGKFGNGVLYELRPDGTYSVLHNFAGKARDGAEPEGLFMDKAGTLYGGARPTSLTFNECDQAGSSPPSGCGVIYSYDPGTGTFKRLYAIRGYKDGLSPLIGGADEAGDLFGATPYGGAFGQGVLFVLRNTSGSYTYHVLHDFTGKADGGFPARPVVDVHGGVIGTTELQSQSSKKEQGTLYSYKGGVFTTLYTFTGGADGSRPSGTPVVKGHTIYGTASEGGLSNCPSSGNSICGTVWTYTPMP